MRRGRTALVPMVAAAVLAAAITSAVPRAGASVGLADWVGPGRTGSRTAYNGYAGIGAAQVTQATRRWRVAGGTFRAPIISASTVVVADQGVGGRSRLEAFDLTTGKRRWIHDFGAAATTTVGPPSTDGARVTLIIERQSGSSWLYDLYALDFATGATRWRAPLGASKVRVAMQPAYALYNSVYAPWVATRGVTHIAKYTAGTGTWQWSAVAPAARTYAVAYGAVWIALRTAVLRIDADTGLLIQNLSAPDATSIAVAGNQLVVGDGTRVAVIDTEFNTTVMSATTDPGCRAVVRVVTLAWIFATQSCPTGRPIALDRAAGGTAHPSAPAAGGVISASSASVVLGATAARTIVAFNAQTLQPVAPFTTTGKVSVGFGAGPVVGWSRIVVPEIGWLEVYD